MNSSAKLARSEAMRMSANSASSMPQPTLGPFTAAMTGLSQSSAAIAAGVAQRGAVADSAGRRSPVIISFTSSPAQKAGSAPVMTTQHTVSSVAATQKAASISS